MNNKAIAAIALLVMVCAPIALGYILNVQDVDDSEWRRGDVSQLNSYLETDRINDYVPYTGIYNNYYGFYDGTTTTGKAGLAQLDFVSVTDTYSSVPVAGDGTPTQITSSGMSSRISLDTYGGDSYKVAFDGLRAHDYDITFLDGTGTGISFPGQSGSGDPNSIEMIKSGSSVAIGNTVYSDVATVGLYIGTGQVVTIIPTITVGYADVSKGWYVENNIPMSWYKGNNLADYGIILMVDMPVSTSFYIYNIDLSSQYTHFSRDASGTVTITTFDGSTETYTLGNYQYLMIETNLFDNGIVSGIASWPQMGTTPTPINSIEIDHIIRGQRILTDSSDITFRVDRSYMLNATYPIARDVTIDVPAIKPAMKSYDLDLYYTSIAGSSVTFAGQTFPVIDNKIHVGLRTFDLSKGHLIISSRTEDSVTWYNYINDISVGTTNTIQAPTLNGDWSIGTYNLYGLTMIHSVSSEWVPGSFGLDMSEVALIGLGVCAVAFIALGMTGKASGAKAIILAVICGGGALIFAVMI